MTSTSDEVGHTAHYFAAQHGFERRPDILRKAPQRRAAPEFVASFRDGKDRDEFLRRYEAHDALVKALERIDGHGSVAEPVRSDYETDQEYWEAFGVWRMALIARAALSQAKGGK